MYAWYPIKLFTNNEHKQTYNHSTKLQQEVPSTIYEWGTQCHHLTDTVPSTQLSHAHKGVYLLITV